MRVRSAGLFVVALALTGASATSARAEPQGCVHASGALAQIACEASTALGPEAEGALVFAAPLATELEPRDRERLVSRIVALIAGALGQRASFEARQGSLEEGRSQARTLRKAKLVFVSIRLSRDRLEVSADLYAVGGKFWQRVKNPSPGPQAHAFSSRPLDAEVRSYLPPVPLIATRTERFKGSDADVLALSCGDTDGDGSSEIVVVGRHRISVGRLRAAEFKAERSVAWSALVPVAPAPWREPVATATIAGPGALDVGCTDRAEGVRLDGALAKVMALGRSLPWPGTRACTRIEGLGLSTEASPCAERPRADTAQSADAVAGAEFALPSGELQRVRAFRSSDATVTLVSAAGQRATLPAAGAQLAVADLDGDGQVELLSSVDTLDAAEDAVLAHTWAPAGQLELKFRVPVPAGVRALAVCPFEGAGIAPIVIGTAEGLWIVR